MNAKEKFALSVVQNCYDYLDGKINKEEVFQSHHNENFSIDFNINIPRIVYMRDCFKDKFPIQLMNNIIYHNEVRFDKYSKIISFRDSVSFDKKKIEAISNNIIAYLFEYIREDFDSFKYLIKQDKISNIIMHAYILKFIEPIDLYYCSRYIPIVTPYEQLKQFFDFCNDRIEMKDKNFVEKIKEVMKKIIQKYESMR